MVGRLAAAMFALALGMGSAGAQQTPAAPAAPPARISAVVEKLDGQVLTVKTNDGAEMTATLTPTATITVIKPATLADVKPNQFIGCTAVEGADGKLRAQEIHIIPESLRGLGEGHYPWGADPKTTMTNGNIEQFTGVSTGKTIKVTYKGGQSEIIVPPSVPVTMMVVAAPDALKPGAKVVLFGGKNAAGEMFAAFITVGP